VTIYQFSEESTQKSASYKVLTGSLARPIAELWLKFGSKGTQLLWWSLKD